MALLRVRAKLRETRSACAECERARAGAVAVLDTVPLAAFRWSAGAEDDGYSVQTVAYPKFMAELVPGDAAQLEAARQVLQRDGTAFSLPVRLGGGEVFVIEGRQAASDETVLWLLDGGPAARARQAGEEAANLRELIDTIPMPVWRRDRDRTLVDCNNAYAAALDATHELVLAQSRELAPVGSRETAREFAAGPDRRGSRRHVVIGGSRRQLDIFELPCTDGGAIGFAIDRTDVENAETDLRRH